MKKGKKPPRLRLEGIKLEEAPKRREKKLLKIPGRLEPEKLGKKPKKDLIKIPVKPVSEPQAVEAKAEPKIPKKLEFEALKPEEIENILADMTPKEPKAIEKKIRQGKYAQALPALKKWLWQHAQEWDWKTLTAAVALILIVFIGGLVWYKVYQNVDDWDETKDVELPVSEVYKPEKTQAEEVIEKFREKVNQEYQEEIGGEAPVVTPTAQKTPVSNQPASYVRTGKPSATSSELNIYVIGKFLSDANLYSRLPKDSNFQLGFYDETGEPVQQFFYYIEGGYAVQGKTRSAEFYLYIPVYYAGLIATYPDPCGLAREIYNKRSYKITLMRSEMTLRQKYGALLRGVTNCQNR